MPLYEYRCPKGHTFEVRVDMDKCSAAQPCPEHHKQGRRIISADSVSIKMGKGHFLNGPRNIPGGKV